MSAYAKRVAQTDSGLTGSSWDQSYQNDLENGLGQDESADLTQLESWFDNCNAPMKVLEYLSSEEFPLSPNNPTRTTERPSVLDLGCGNGSSLFELKLEGEYPGQMVGVDYSQGSIDLSRRLWTKYIEQQEEADDAHQLGEIIFARFDIMQDDPSSQSWWPGDGFDLVVDKGTFDAVSLSDEMTTVRGKEVRICEAYPAKAARMVKPGGYLLITSCNWTEEEVVRWFTQGADADGVLQVYGRVRYPVYEYSGAKGSSVASVCFRKIDS